MPLLLFFVFCSFQCAPFLSRYANAINMPNEIVSSNPGTGASASGFYSDEGVEPGEGVGISATLTETLVLPIFPSASLKHHTTFHGKSHFLLMTLALCILSKFH